MVVACRCGQSGAIDDGSPDGRQTVLQRFWLWLFALYSAAALPLLGWALANLAA
jgi:hypothetical protein